MGFQIWIPFIEMSEMRMRKIAFYSLLNQMLAKGLPTLKYIRSSKFMIPAE